MPYHEALERFSLGVDRDGHLYSAADITPQYLGLARAEWAETMRSARTSTITCIEAWDYQKQSIVCIGPGDTSSRGGSLGIGTLVRETEHHYGDPNLKTLRGPYFHALGTTTASRMPERSGLSILFGFLRLFPLLDSMLTIQANGAFTDRFPAFRAHFCRRSTPSILKARCRTAPIGWRSPPLGTDQARRDLPV